MLNLPDRSDRQQATRALLAAAGILPVVTVHSVEQALTIAEALQRGGLHSIELTLRTPVALAAIAALKRANPQLVVGAGTLLDPAQIAAAEQSGADFLVTPGTTPTMLAALARCPLPAIPGAATVSELLMLAEHGFDTAKWFPAASLGGLAALSALQGPLSHFKFCPTGGIGEGEAADYLALPNVLCIGGSWMVSAAWTSDGHFDKISASASRASAIVAARQR